MTGTKILWGQIIIVSLIVLTTTWAGHAVDSAAARIPTATRHAVVRALWLANLSSASLLLVVVCL